jgi:cold shock CspA family protein
VSQGEKVGLLIGWNAHRGFGFLAPIDKSTSGDVFVHVSQFQSVGIVPRIGQRFTFEVIPDRSGRVQAVNLRAI